MNSKIINKLIENAKEISKNAYAPYSNFHVGASLITEKGNVFSGVNVENSSYGATICAERNAILNAVATEGATMRIDAISVVTTSSPPAAPCGLCLQVMAEFAHDDILVILTNHKEEQIEIKLRELLPKAFRKHFLDKK